MTSAAPLLALRSRYFPLLPRNSSIISHFSLAFLARVSLFRFSQLLALRRTLSTGNLCRIRTLSGVHRTLEESSRDLSLFKFKYGAVVLFVVLGLLNSLFKGKAVAKLLFKPFGFVMKSDGLFSS
ncbi:hypothetical protein PS2_006032 [Malus domestica]